MSCANANISPMVLPFGNVTVDGNGVAKLGVTIELGTPPQRMSFLPSVIDDAIAIANPDHCLRGSANVSCAAGWGGLYESTNSTSYNPVSSENWNGTHVTKDGRTAIAWFNEALHVGDKVIYGAPITEYNPDIFPNMLGINENSSFLSIATSSGILPTKSWGMWAGSTDPDQEMNGALVLGGYDEARIDGHSYTFNATSDCLACVYIKSLTYDAPSGTNTSLYESSASNPLTVALSPEIADLQLPISAFNKFAQTTGIGTYSTMGMGWPKGTSLGNLSVEFFNGLTVTIPGEELFEPYTGYEPSGQYVILNDSVTISRLTNRSDGLVPNFGVPFFTASYMTFHPDEKYLTLAKAARDPDIQSSIIPFCKSSNSTNSTSSGSNSAGSDSGSSSHAGAIAGGVVGGLAGLALIAALVWFLLRRRKRQQPDVLETTSAAAGKGSDNESDPYSPSDIHYSPTAAAPVSEKTAELPTGTVLAEKTSELPTRTFLAEKTPELPTSPLAAELPSTNTANWFGDHQIDTKLELPSETTYQRHELPS